MWDSEHPKRHGSAHDQAVPVAGAGHTPKAGAHCPAAEQTHLGAVVSTELTAVQDACCQEGPEKMRGSPELLGSMSRRAAARGARAGASSLHFWGCPRAVSQGLSKLTVIWGLVNQHPGRHPMLRKRGQLSPPPFLLSWRMEAGPGPAAGSQLCIRRTWAVGCSQELLCL